VEGLVDELVKEQRVGERGFGIGETREVAPQLAVAQLEVGVACLEPDEQLSQVFLVLLPHLPGFAHLLPGVLELGLQAL
jgi:hypothetical protein